MKNQKNAFTAAIVVLAIALIGSLIWGSSTSTKVDQLQVEKMAVNASLEEMLAFRDELAAEVDSLVLAYEALAADNSSLQGQMAQSLEELERAKSALSQAKRSAAGEMKDLRAQIAELQTIKQNLQLNMDMMLAQNDSLRQVVGELEGNLALTNEENTLLNQDNEQKGQAIQTLTYETFKATSFQISPEVKRGEATSKSGRVRRITASFDLDHVPADYQGTRPIYLVITDEAGTPIPHTDYISTTVQPLNGTAQDIMAIEVREEKLADSQRLTFTHELENKLDAGNYTLSAYTDVGLLGSSTFRLR